MMKLKFWKKGFAIFTIYLSLMPISKTLASEFYYNSSNGRTSVGVLDSTGNYITQKSYKLASFSTGWTHIVSSPITNIIFYYNSSNGSASVGYLDSNGEYISSRSYEPGYFGTGWTNIVIKPSNYFGSIIGDVFVFYNSNNGRVSVGTFDAGSEYTTLKSYEPGYFGTGWTNIVNTPNGILFYNSNNGRASVGTFDNQGNYTTLKDY